MTQTQNKIEFTRINNDVNGNPRYVCHYTNLLTDLDRDDYSLIGNITAQYALALIRAKKIGGKKFHNKQYGGGIVFQSYNIADTERKIWELVKG